MKESRCRNEGEAGSLCSLPGSRVGMGEMVVPFVEFFSLIRGAPVSISTKWGYGTMVKTKGGLVNLLAAVFSELKYTQPVPSLLGLCYLLAQLMNYFSSHVGVNGW